MTPEEIGNMLKVLNAFDARIKLGDEPTMLAWGTAARVGRWTYASATQAIAEFFALPADPNGPRRWIEPGNVTYLIRAKRRQPPTMDELRGEQRALGAAGPADPRTRERIMQMLADAAAKRRESDSPGFGAPVSPGRGDRRSSSKLAREVGRS